MRGPKNNRGAKPMARGPAHPLAARKAAASSDEDAPPVRKIDGRARGFAHLQAGRTAAPKAPKPVAAPRPERADAPSDDAERAPKERPLDGEGRPYMTLAQMLKAAKIVESGGEAKHRVREGGILVNGKPEDRPGRKLHAGDVVTVDGDELTVDLG